MSVSEPSRTASKAAAAAWFEVSLPTVDAWLRRGCPVVTQGSNGKPYELDLLAVAEWYFTDQKVVGGTDPDDLRPQDRKAWFDSEKTRLAIAERCRELIPVVEVEEVMATAFAAIAQGLRAIPDNVERRLGVEPSVAGEIEKIIDAEMDALADRLSVLEAADQTDEVTK